MRKKGELLVENIIFLVLNMMFITILVLFLIKQGSGAVVLEQSYSKQLALLIDSSNPSIEIKLNMEKGMKISESNEIDFGDVVKITGNSVNVKLTEKGGYSYSFFNDVQVIAYPERNSEGEYDGIYVLTINKNG